MALEPVAEEPTLTEADVESTESEPIAEALVTEPIVEEPVTEPTVEGSIPEPTVESPIREPVVEASVIEPVAEAPAVTQNEEPLAPVVESGKLVTSAWKSIFFNGGKYFWKLRLTSLLFSYIGIKKQSLQL